MDARDNQTEATVARRAAEWFVAHREGPLAARDRAAFTEWLRESPMHIREYLAIAGLAKTFESEFRDPDLELDELIAAAKAPGEGEERENVTSLDDRIQRPSDTPVMRAMPDRFNAARRRPVVRVLQWAAAAGLAAVLIGASPWILEQTQRLLGTQRLQTAHGEQRVWRLADGSVVHLNSASQIGVRFTDTERVVEVMRGQALFNVEHDAKRRFRVVAGMAEVVAVGTAFDVYRKDDATVVTVVEGMVAIYEAAEAEMGTQADPPADSGGSAEAGSQGRTRELPSERASLALSAGEQVRVAPRTRAAAAKRVNVGKAVAWTQQQIIFDAERLADVAREFNRYGRAPIVIDDTALGDLRVTGIFNAYDTESFLGFIDRLDGVDVRQTEDRIHVTAGR